MRTQTALSSLGRRALCLVLLSLAIVGARATEPPDMMSYQGVLRDAADNPLTGDHDMVFRFWSADTGGDEIMIDRHTALGSAPVTVSDGMFGVELGGGQVEDGSGPDIFTTLHKVFKNYRTVWLEIEVGGEVLSPRVRARSAAYAFNAMHLGGRIHNQYLNDSDISQTKNGRLVLDTSALEATPALQAFGSLYGGYFEDTVEGSHAYVATGGYGVAAYGNIAGGYFEDTDLGGRAYVGAGNVGIDASGPAGGGIFSDADNSGYAQVAFHETGISAFGDYSGGYFSDLNGNGYANVGITDMGISAHGQWRGGEFTDLDGSGRADLADGDTGIFAYGHTQGGYFADTDSSGVAYIAYGDRGVEGFGAAGGGYFADTTNSGYGYVGYGDFGVVGRGDFAGGSFEDLTTNNFARVGYETYKVYGTGSVSFVQNHPGDADKVVVYHAPEASEVAVYTRGNARLENGVARVILDETFQWTANPDLGLTAHLTAREVLDAPLIAESVSTTELVVRGPDGSTAEFDYMVWGLRIGFEESAPVQQKESEAYIPAMTEHRERYAKDADLRRFNALERFRGMKVDAEGVDDAALDLSRAAELIARIGEYDPAVHGAEASMDRQAAPEPTPIPSADDTSQSGSPQISARAGEATPDAGVPAIAGSAAAQRPVDVGEAHPAEQEAVSSTSLPVIEPVQRGDLLTFDALQPDLFRRAASMAEPDVVGIAAGPSRETADGTFEVPVSEGRYTSVNVDAGYGAIRPGDLLVASPTPGHAMKAIEIAPGTIVGKALEGRDTGTGLIRVVLMLQ